MELIVSSMERLEADSSEEARQRAAQLWQHISAQLIYFVVYYFADFAQLMIKLRTKVGPAHHQTTHNGGPCSCSNYTQRWALLMLQLHTKMGPAHDPTAHKGGPYS